MLGNANMYYESLLHFKGFQRKIQWIPIDFTKY